MGYLIDGALSGGCVLGLENGQELVKPYLPRSVLVHLPHLVGTRDKIGVVLNHSVDIGKCSTSKRQLVVPFEHRHERASLVREHFLTGSSPLRRKYIAGTGCNTTADESRARTATTAQLFLSRESAP